MHAHGNLQVICQHTDKNTTKYSNSKTSVGLCKHTNLHTTLLNKTINESQYLCKVYCDVIVHVVDNISSYCPDVIDRNIIMATKEILCSLDQQTNECISCICYHKKHQTSL